MKIINISSLFEKLRTKIKKGQISNREDGYNNGVLCVMSKAKKVFEFKDEKPNIEIYNQFTDFQKIKEKKGINLKPYDEGFNEGLKEAVAELISFANKFK